jgi:hypothetical protein
MTPIIVDDLLKVQEFKEIWPDFKAIEPHKLDSLEEGMEVKLRWSGEYFRVRVESIKNDTITGIVLPKKFYFRPPFGSGDLIQFKKDNIIDIYDITRWGVKL